MSDGPHASLKQHAEHLADWAFERMANRTDACGGYYRKNNKTTTTTRKKITLSELLAQHFQASKTDHVIGLHSICPKTNTSKWLAFDIDKHTDGDDPLENWKAVQEIATRLESHRLTPHVFDSNGAGGYHVFVFFEEPQPTDRVHVFGNQIIEALPIAVEVFPKQSSIAPTAYGNWIRVPGRHHTRDHWTKVWTGEHWNALTADYLLKIEGDDVAGLLPDSSSRTQDCRATYDESFEAPASEVSVVIRKLESTPPAIQGQKGQNATYVVCCMATRDHGLSVDQAMVALSDWNQRCDPPWSRGELIEIIENARKYGRNPQGSETAEENFGNWSRHAPPSAEASPAQPKQVDTNSDQPVDPFAAFKVSAIQEDGATWTPVEHLTTGIHDLDRVLGGGFRCKSVCCICGKTGRGKTTTCIQCAANAAAAGIPTAIFSLELDRQDVMRLLLAQQGKVPRKFLDRFDVRGEYGERLLKAKQEVAQWPLWILDADAWQGPMDRVKLALKVSEGVQRHGWRLVVVDYLGLLANLQNEVQYQADVENSTALKAIARQNDIALVAVTSLRKSASYAPNARNKPKSIPTIDDLLGAGRLVYDAASVLYIDSTKDKYEPGRERMGEITVSVLKSRYTGASSKDAPISLKWYPGCGRIIDNVMNMKPDATEGVEELEDAPF